MNTAAQNRALVAGSVTLSLALGTRSAFGLLLVPLAAQGISVANVALAIAIHNLAWGVFQPVAGAWADRRGASGAQVFGGICYAAGFALPALVPATWTVMLGLGLLTGIGTAFLGWGVAMTGVARAFPAEQRTAATGLASAGGSVGQMLFLPIVVAAIAYGGASLALLVLAVAMLVAIHQIGGFIGAWVGGLMFQFTGGYDIAFIATAASGLVAAAFNLPIRLPRIAIA